MKEKEKDWWFKKREECEESISDIRFSTDRTTKAYFDGKLDMFIACKAQRDKEIRNDYEKGFKQDREGMIRQNLTKEEIDYILNELLSSEGINSDEFDINAFNKLTSKDFQCMGIKEYDLIKSILNKLKEWESFKEELKDEE